MGAVKNHFHDEICAAADDHPALCPPFRRNHFEEAMSDLICQIGMIERLNDLEPDQLDRLRQAVIRLSNSERKHSRE